MKFKPEKMPPSTLMILGERPGDPKSVPVTDQSQFYYARYWDAFRHKWVIVKVLHHGHFPPDVDQPIRVQYNHARLLEIISFL